MSKHHRIDYLELPARDMEAAQEFYGRVFGFTFVSYGPDYLAFNDGGIDGGFYRAELATQTATGGALVVLFSDDLEATQERVEKHGGRIVKPIFSFPGGRRFQFEDPNGNELAVWGELPDA